MEGWYKDNPITVDALITYPEGEGPFPLLLIVHSSAGAGEFTKDWLEFMRDQQKPLLDMGIATMYLDNFSARGVKNISFDLFSEVNEIYFLLSKVSPRLITVSIPLLSIS